MLLAALALAACGDRAPRAPVTLTVAAASSLREAMGELGRAYERANPGVRVRTTFGASGALRQQVQQGAPVDVFVSASDTPMDALQKAGLIDARTRRPLAGNELVLVVPKSSPSTEVNSFRALAGPAVKRVAIGTPASVPAGEYADEVLRSLGVDRDVSPKAVYAQNVRQVLGYVESGNVDAGIVYRTDAATSGRVRVAATAPAGSHRPILYPVAVVSRSPNAAAARAYVAFLLGPDARKVLLRRGFTTPQAP